MRNINKLVLYLGACLCVTYDGFSDNLLGNVVHLSVNLGDGGAATAIAVVNAGQSGTLVLSPSISPTVLAGTISLSIIQFDNHFAVPPP